MSVYGEGIIGGLVGLKVGEALAMWLWGPRELTSSGALGQAALLVALWAGWVMAVRLGWRARSRGGGR